jgi:integrase
MAKPKATRKTDWIFQRPGSNNWWVKLRSGGQRFEKSLGTPDREQAVILSLPMIAEHKAKLLAARPRVERTWQHKLEPGRKHVAPDGGEIIATDKELFYIGHNGAITRTEPNGAPAFKLVGGPLTVRSLAEAFINTDAFGEPGRRLALPKKSADDAILETYLKHANVTGYPEREARAMWSLFRMLTNGIPLSEATRDDGRKLVEHLKNGGAKSATIQKKVMWLNAACNLAIKEGRLKFNPFAGIVPKCDDIEKRLPLSDSDMKECKRKLTQLSAADQLLFRLLATTGMRLSEAYEIDSEQKERSCRFVTVGKKTEQSLRRVPLPADVLAYLPKAIKGPLFKGDTPAAASKRLNRFLRDLGITDSRKVIHSLRHRAQDRLRAAECPQDVRWALLGHEEKTVAAGYGEGFAVTVLRKWIDKIGF